MKHPQLNYKNFGAELVEKWIQLTGSIDSEEMGEIRKNAEADLFANINGHFSEENLAKLLQVILQKILQAHSGNHMLSQRNVWEQIVDEFHRSKYWGIPLQKGAPAKIPLTEEQKNQWELWTYIWALIQSTVILKMAIYYFGIRAAEDQDSELKVYLYALIALSAFLLSSFVYRKWRREKKESEQQKKNPSKT